MGAPSQGDPIARVAGSALRSSRARRTTHRRAELWLGLALALAAFLRLQVQVKYCRHRGAGPAGPSARTSCAVTDSPGRALASSLRDVDGGRARRLRNTSPTQESAASP